MNALYEIKAAIDVEQHKIRMEVNDLDKQSKKVDPYWTAAFKCCQERMALCERLQRLVTDQIRTQWASIK